MFHTVVEEMVAGKVRVALSSRVLALAPGAPSLPGQGASRADRISSARSGILGEQLLLSLPGLNMKDTNSQFYGITI